MTIHPTTDALQTALYQIAEKTSSAEDLTELYSSIHGILGSLMYARNCYIALYDPSTQIVEFPYFRDDMEQPPGPQTLGRGLTEYVLRTGEPLLATQHELEALVDAGEIARTGPRSLDWLGVPLKKGATTFGVLVLQTYAENIRYCEKEKELLIFVSQQIASAIERKRAAKALAESESKFRAVAESAIPAIYIHNGKKLLYVNPAAEQLFGFSREELLKMKDPWVLVPPVSRDDASTTAADRMEGKQTPARYEIPIYSNSRGLRWIDLSASVIEFSGEKAILATAIDISKRKRAEQLQSALYSISEQASSADDLDKLYASIHEIVGTLMYAENFYIAFYDEHSQNIHFPYVVDSEGSIPTSRKAGKGLTEYVLRTGEPLLVSPEALEDLLGRGEIWQSGAKAIDWLGVPLKKGDKTFGVLAVQTYKEKIRFTEENKEVLTFVSQQVASAVEHKRNEAALRRSEARYRSLIEGATYGIYRADDNGFVSANPALVHMLGYENEAEVLALEMTTDVYCHPSERARILDQFGLPGEGYGFEVTWKRKDGSTILVRLSGRVLCDESGKMFCEGIVENIAERRALEEQLRQSQKMEAVGKLAGGIAHDFNNLLTVIKGYSELVLEKTNDNVEVSSEVLEIKRAAERAASLTGQLLAFSRQQVIAPRTLHLNKLIANLDQLLRPLLGEDVRLELKLSPKLGCIQADPCQIEQIIMNLAVNARDAMPYGGSLTILTESVVVTMARSQEHLSIEPGRYMMFAVSDTGVGMDERTRARVFEPFFTTKELGKGTGLGLSIVYGIVKQHGGHITVKSDLGAGTTFRVYLPASEASAEIAGPEKLPAVEKGNESILVVEDEDGVRSLVRQILTKKGYQVSVAGTVREALVIVENNPGIDLLLTDVVLPDASGRELVRQLALSCPTLKTLFMSGYTDDAMLRHGVSEAHTAFLQKPFTVDSLAQKVREVLDTVPSTH